MYDVLILFVYDVLIYMTLTNSRYRVVFINNGAVVQALGALIRMMRATVGAMLVASIGVVMRSDLMFPGAKKIAGPGATS